MFNTIIRELNNNDAFDLQLNLFNHRPVQDIVLETNVKINHMINGAAYYIVAVVGGRVVGHMGLIFNNDYSEHHTAELVSVIVNEYFRGQGLCRLMFENCCNYARSRGIKILHLRVKNGNPAEIIYQKFGFSKFGHLPNAVIDPICNQLCDVCYYYLNL